MPLAPSEEAKLRSFCHAHNLPVHLQARSRELAGSIMEPSISELKAEVMEAC